MIRLIDPNYAGNRVRYLAQCVLASIIVFIIVMILDIIAQAAIISALGASSFIAFTMPHRNVSRPRYLVGGYAVGVVVGLSCRMLGTLPWEEWLWLHPHVETNALVGVAVGVTMFLMVVTNTEHPPAAGVAFGLTIIEPSLRTVLVIVVGIVSLAVVKRLCQPHLLDLI